MNPPPSVDDIIQTLQGILKGSPSSIPSSPPVAEKTEGPPPSEEKPSPTHAEEIIRIRATLLETLNTLSTENNMIRVGFEQYVSNLGTTVKGFRVDVKRLAAQLTNLSSLLQSYQMEAEVVHSRESPLETQQKIIKRYSELDQIANVMRETTVDLAHALKEIHECHANMESLLLNQTRISSELQHRLSDTRLVPFESIVPRLSRIARQVSQELKKQIDFKVLRSEGEMDRTLLEHLVPSLEHILRNAIDHGIESADDRQKKGKPALGKIEVKFARVGSIASIEIQDDGAGIDPDAIRRKAIKLGLLAPDQTVSDEEVIRYILEPGFSTRESVSLVSGRGVGMDVVATAVKEMGGTLNIVSKVGVGTHMVIRFPFTSSLNRVLLFDVQNKQYGMLLSDIQGIASIQSDALEKTLAFPSPIIQHADKPYHLNYLGALLDPNKKEIYLEKNKSFPIILLPSNEYPLALIVDTVQNSRELLVQSLGGQFKLMDECSGATLLGDGRVVYILDREALIKKAKGSQEQIKEGAALKVHQERAPSMLPTILVVDDSASARAVAKQLLEREHYRVLTANDGLDALKEIELQKPDLILLDVDMPRMDGFELATTLRRDERTKHIPIIMVTALVSPERREQAKELKLEGFISKPFDEVQLLLTLQSQLSKSS